MRSKKELCQNWKLYVITDRASLNGRALGDVVRLAIEGGADVIQLRDKSASEDALLRTARELLELTRAAGIPLIINDNVGVALKSGADGVHLGQEDGPLAAARRTLGENAIIGRSTHSPEQALAAEKEGFDYIGIGPVFATPTKPDYRPVGLSLVSFAAEHIRIPFVAIGGIDTANLPDVRKAGARCVAAVRAIMGAGSPLETARVFADRAQPVRRLIKGK